MMLSDRKHLARFNGNSPATQSSIQHLEGESGFRLPEDYIFFLQHSNGGEGFIGNAYVILWPVEQLIEMNRAYHVADYAPGLFLFGSDGGGEAFAFDTRSKAMPIASVPFVGMALEVARPLASSFGAFLKELSKA
ncbi:MAG TPA: SMI1/KNR4 family protein [Gemmatimonadales bacterium]|nr:SMI1/KNR4 family protein [Gemmatimonadales bacterium]